MDVTARAKRLNGAAYWILLVASAIQGFTPDRSDLSSSWLLGLISAVEDAGPSGDLASTSLPAPTDQAPGDMGELVAMVTRGAPVRGRSPADYWDQLHFLPTGPPEPPMASSSDRHRPPDDLATGADKRLPSLCRFLC